MPEFATSGIRLKPLTSDPSALRDGDMWERSTGQVYARVSGTTLEFAFIEDLGTAAFEDSATFARADEYVVEFDTIADLKSYTGVARHAVVKGYTTAGDGGGGRFYRDSGSAAASDNGLVFTPDTLSGKWLRIYQGPIDVRWFGAVGRDEGAAVVDFTDEIQAAATAVPDNGSLYFPGGRIYDISPQSGQNYGVLISSKRITVFGHGAIISFATTDQKQAMRFESCDGITMSGLRFVGSGTDGSNGGQGLVQVFQGSRVRISDCEFVDANCDGLAIAQATDVHVVGCLFENCSKDSLYPNDCTDVRLIGNLVKDFGGHDVSGSIVGSGIHPAGCTNCVVHGNIINGGTGIGIYCNNTVSNAPKGYVLKGNFVRGVSNPTNTTLSDGISLRNGHTDKDCGTIVDGNEVVACARYSYYVENHDGAKLTSNISIESVQSAFVFSTINGLEVDGNTAWNTNTSNTSSQHAFITINSAANVSFGGDNRAEALTSFATSYGAHDFSDGASGATQFYERKYGVREYSTTWNPNGGSAMSTGTQVSVDITGTQAAFGEYVEVAAPYNLNDCHAWAYVKNSGTVTVILRNDSGVSRTFTSGDWKIRIKGANL